MTMPMTDAPLATIIGGSGFVGRYIAQAMAKRGWRVRVACRRPNEAHFVRPYGVVGQVEPVQCNIRNEASLRQVISGAQAVVNCVGVLFESGKNTFDATQAEGAGRAARIAAEEGVGQFVQISAIGADADSEAAYARTKAAGEAKVREAFPDAVILRPSIVFGTEDQFFNRFAAWRGSRRCCRWWARTLASSPSGCRTSPMPPPRRRWARPARGSTSSADPTPTPSASSCS